MKKSWFVLVILFSVIALLGGIKLVGSSSYKAAPQSQVSLALDWTPNTNHTGIYVAIAKGWYKQAGIELNLLPYSASVSSDQLVSSGKADLGISSTEAIVSDAGAGTPVVSIAAIVAHNTSVLAVRQDAGVSNPRQLDGKVYGGFGAPYESAVIKQVIRHAGGTGTFDNVTLDIDPVQALQTRRVDFAWVFAGWEVIEAQRAGLRLTTFPITEYGVPDYSTPNIITSPSTMKAKKALLQKFMTATSRGYTYAAAHPAEAAQMLIDTAPKGTFPDPGLVKQSQAYLSPRYRDAGRQWGIQSQASWHNYPQFMIDRQAVLDTSGKPVKKLNLQALYSNEFLE
ncbi:MAG TPA: ABC transporter substrate-binding protein [Candidatus Saccharimonadales bacterium]